MSHTPFRILSLDGGGIRGIFSVQILARIEADLQAMGLAQWQTHHHFQLICGTSTGGILALGLSLGIPASTLLDLYLQGAEQIFGKPRGFLGNLLAAKHDRKGLERLLLQTFEQEGKQPTLAQCKTALCVPAYDLLDGYPRLFKTPHHPLYLQDQHVPAYQVALATSAAPTYFDAYDGQYPDAQGRMQHFSNLIDGGVIANNPTLIGIVEAQSAFGRDLSELQVLSIGTGTRKFAEASDRKRWGNLYWVGKTRILDVLLQGQSQNTENLVNLLCHGGQYAAQPRFVYQRINTELPPDRPFEMDETDPERLRALAQLASNLYARMAPELLGTFFGQNVLSLPHTIPSFHASAQESPHRHREL